LIVGLSPSAATPTELIIHLGMTGRLQVSPVLQSSTHLHASWEIKCPASTSSSWLTFTDPRRFGRLELVPAGEYVSIPGLRTLGPDATDPAAIVERVKLLSRSSRPIKAALLDQSVLAGAGNIYCDEALFAARLHPATPCSSLSANDRQVLATALAASIESSIKNGGTTFRDYRQVDGSTGSNVQALQCYGRSGLPCLRCGTLMKSVKLVGRTTCYCPACQVIPRQSS
jgi:formamidopyrimidine-DNA glycosylase